MLLDRMSYVEQWRGVVSGQMGPKMLERYGMTENATDEMRYQTLDAQMTVRPVPEKPD